MVKITEIVEKMPPMLSGKELISSLAVLPEYNVNIRESSVSERLIALSDLYSIFIPSKMSQEIYSKLYLALLRSLQKKCTKVVMQQQKENFKAIQQKAYSGGIIGGSDSFSIIGSSGIGKSSSISRAIELITNTAVIEINDPYSKIIPVLCVQCPFDSSVKGLMLELLRKVDELLDSKYYENALRRKSTTDTLIGAVSQIALNNIGLLIIDEVQNVANSKNGKSLVGSLTQLVNNSGISIALVGTPETTMFFEQAMHLARRTLGLQYSSLEYGIEFVEFCKIMFQYQYTKNHTDITDGIIEWLYQHSGGNVSIVVSLIHDAQEISILSGREILDIESLNEAYVQRMSMLHDYIEPNIRRNKQTSTKKKQISAAICEETNDDYVESDWNIADLVIKAKEEKLDIVSLLKEKITVVEIRA